jgi:ribosome maturation factor RimP
MTHPVIPPVLELAAPVAAALGLEVVEAVFRTNHNPPVLQLNVRNCAQDTGLDDCERMSRAFELVLDEAGLFPDLYILEVSSPGVSKILQTDREFISFKGFPVLVTANNPIEDKTEWRGNLIGRDETAVKVSLKGRIITVPRELIAQVQLEDHPEPTE